MEKVAEQIVEHHVMALVALMEKKLVFKALQVFLNH